MSEDLIWRTLELGSGVKLTYPSDYELEDLSILAHWLNSNTDPPSKVFIQKEYRQIIDGKTSSDSSTGGSSPAS